MIRQKIQNNRPLYTGLVTGPFFHSVGTNRIRSVLLRSPDVVRRRKSLRVPVYLLPSVDLLWGQMNPWSLLPLFLFYKKSVVMTDKLNWISFMRIQEYKNMNHISFIQHRNKSTFFLALLPFFLLWKHKTKQIRRDESVILGNINKDSLGPFRVICNDPVRNRSITVFD